MIYGFRIYGLVFIDLELVESDLDVMSEQIVQQGLSLLGSLHCKILDEVESHI